MYMYITSINKKVFFFRQNERKTLKYKNFSLENKIFLLENQGCWTFAYERSCTAVGTIKFLTKHSRPPYLSRHFSGELSIQSATASNSLSVLYTRSQSLPCFEGNTTELHSPLLQSVPKKCPPIEIILLL